MILELFAVIVIFIAFMCLCGVGDRAIGFLVALAGFVIVMIVLGFFFGIGIDLWEVAKPWVLANLF